MNATAKRSRRDADLIAEHLVQLRGIERRPDAPKHLPHLRRALERVVIRAGLNLAGPKALPIEGAVTCRLMGRGIAPGTCDGRCDDCAEAPRG